ncbi:MAG: hypothetical protein KDB14_18390 [Planctomycetales bacterium]|nr:hypothetical protein [Planctomycetales bacterium]
MRAIVPGVLWVGNALEARDVAGVLAAGISVVIDLAIEEPPIQFPRDVAYCRFPLLDGAGNGDAVLRSAIDTAAHLIAASQPTLVACSAGVSRSPAIASAALAKALSLDLKTSLARVAGIGPPGLTRVACDGGPTSPPGLTRVACDGGPTSPCDISPGLWADICRVTLPEAPPAPAAALHLLVIRSLAPDRTVQFYEQLGLTFCREQHGSGPVHWSTNLADTLLEVYPAQSEQEVDRSTRLGLRLADVESTATELRQCDVVVVSEPRETSRGLCAVVKDPDGRSVELLQLRGHELR